MVLLQYRDGTWDSQSVPGIWDDKPTCWRSLGVPPWVHQHPPCKLPLHLGPAARAHAAASCLGKDGPARGDPEPGTQSSLPTQSLWPAGLPPSGQVRGLAGIQCQCWGGDVRTLCFIRVTAHRGTKVHCLLILQNFSRAAWVRLGSTRN